MKKILPTILALLSCNIFFAQFTYQIYPGVTGYSQYNIFENDVGFDLTARSFTDIDFHTASINANGQLNEIDSLTTNNDGVFINNEELVLNNADFFSTSLTYELTNINQTVLQSWTFNAPLGEIIRQGVVEEFPDGDLFLSYSTGVTDNNSPEWENVKIHYGKYDKTTGNAIYEEVIDWDNHSLGDHWMAAIYEVGFASDNSLYFAIKQFTVIKSYIFSVDPEGNLGNGGQVSTLERYVQDLTVTADGGAWYWISQLGIIRKFNADGTSTNPFFLFIDQVPMGGVNLGTFVKGPPGTTYIVGKVQPLGYTTEQLMVLAIGDDGSDQGVNFYEPNPDGFYAQEGIYNSDTESIVLVGADGSASSLIARQMAFLNIDLSEPECIDVIPNYTLVGEFEGSKYFISDEKVLWSNAVAGLDAIGNNAHLTSINSQAENDFIQENISEIVSIGINDIGEEGSLEWQNGEVVSFNNYDENCFWCPGNTPDNDFGIFYPWNGNWDFDNQWVLRYALIEVPCNNSQGLTLDIECPDDILVEVPEGATEATISWSTADFSITTNCSNIPDLSFELIDGPQVGANFPLGTSTVKYEITASCDGEIAMAMCSFDVTVESVVTEITLIECSSNIEIQASNSFNYSGAIPTWSPPVASSSCADGMIEITQISGPTSGEFLEVFSSETVEYEITDGCGNVETCIFYITINPDYELVCPQSITITATSSDGAVVDYDEPFFFGTSCGSTPFTPQNGLLSGSLFPVGTTIVPLVSQQTGPSGFCDDQYLCNLTVTVLPFDDGSCPDDIEGFDYLGEFNGSAYFLSNEMTNWEGAVTGADAIGGHLAVVSNNEENEFLKNGLNEITFLGFADNAVEGDITWINGETVDYTNFNTGCSFCPGNSEARDFGIMYPWDGSWDFDGPFTQRKYIVEIACGMDPVDLGISYECLPSLYIEGLHVNNYQEIVFWEEPNPITDCPEGGLTVTQVAGGLPGTELYGPTPSGHPIVYDITDACGNSKQCIFFIFITPEDPIYDCPEDITVTATSENGAIVNYDNPVLTSYCTLGTPIVTGLPSGVSFLLGQPPSRFKIFSTAVLNSVEDHQYFARLM